MGWDGKQAFASGMDITGTRKVTDIVGVTLHVFLTGRWFSDRGVYGFHIVCDGLILAVHMHYPG